MQNKKAKRTKADLKSAVADAGKTAKSGSADAKSADTKSADAKKGVADVGKKGAHGKADSKRGRRR